MDGVKVYKTQKAYVYSFSSLIPKGPSLDTKCLTLLVRDGDLVKPHTHNDIGILLGYIMKVLSMLVTSQLQTREGNLSREERWKLLGQGSPLQGVGGVPLRHSKADLEARVMVHQLTPNWASLAICEHCLASKNEAFSYGDFSDNAAYLDCICLITISFLCWTRPTANLHGYKCRAGTKIGT